MHPRLMGGKGLQQKSTWRHLKELDVLLQHSPCSYQGIDQHDCSCHGRQAKYVPGFIKKSNYTPRFLHQEICNHLSGIIFVKYCGSQRCLKGFNTFSIRSRTSWLSTNST